MVPRKYEKAKYRLDIAQIVAKYSSTSIFNRNPLCSKQFFECAWNKKGSVAKGVKNRFEMIGVTNRKLRSVTMIKLPTKHCHQHHLSPYVTHKLCVSYCDFSFQFPRK